MDELLNTVTIKIKTTDITLDKDLINSFEEDVTNLCGATLKYQGRLLVERGKAPDILNFILTYNLELTTFTIISKWLSQWIFGRVSKLLINGKEVPINPSSIYNFFVILEERDKLID